MHSFVLGELSILDVALLDLEASEYKAKNALSGLKTMRVPGYLIQGIQDALSAIAEAHNELQDWMEDPEGNNV